MAWIGKLVGAAAATGGAVMFAAQTKPEDAVTNLAAWADFIGLDAIIPVLSHSGIDTWATILGAIPVVFAVVFWLRNKLLPTSRENKKESGVDNDKQTQLSAEEERRQQALAAKTSRDAAIAAELQHNRPRREHLVKLCAKSELAEANLDEVWDKVPQRIGCVAQRGEFRGPDGDPFYRIEMQLQDVRRYLVDVESEASLELPVTYNPGIPVAGEENAANEARKYAFRQYACRYRLAKKAFSDLRTTWNAEINGLDRRWENAGKKSPKGIS